ncbi:transposase family protein [Streptosporangium sp. KLBMP 9127]
MGYAFLSVGEREPIRTDRIKVDRPYFSGKHRVHGMNVQVIASPDETVRWTSDALQGKAHNLSAARIWGILKAGIITRHRQGVPRCRGPAHHSVQGQETITVFRPGAPYTDVPVRRASA